ncbi:MAG: hypothetical protein QOJ07_684, partial [Thermoleophilaceae bacterium]|nr:hypothetical protein [Thermoleophilaceae bacterium]
GGDTGPLRLLDQSLGGQAGWLIGFALVGGVALLVATRLRRADARTGWLIAVGGAFLTTAAAFSFAQGIFHPYYVSLLAPFTAALVGAGAAQLARRGAPGRVLAPVAIAGGVAAELFILGNNPGDLGWLRPVIGVAGVASAAALATLEPARLRSGALAGGLAVLLIAPAIWSVQTLGHATNGTFPAGGPVSASGFGGPGGPGRRGGFAGGPGVPGAPGGTTGAMPPPQAGAGGGGPMGGNSASLNSAVAYARSHGGGTVAVSAQNGASSPIIQSGAPVAAIGGFSGRESEVSVSWLAGAVRSGQIRWVLSDGTGGGFGGRSDSRVGSSKVMNAVAQTCRRATTSTSGSLYDCSGQAAALAATAN